MKKETKLKTKIFAFMAIILIVLFAFGVITLATLLISVCFIPIWVFLYDLTVIYKDEMNKWKYAKNHNKYHGKKFTANILDEDVNGKIYTTIYGIYLCFNSKYSLAEKNDDVRLYFGYKNRYFAENLTKKQQKDSEILNFDYEK